MEVVRPASAEKFLDLARPLLAGDPVREARHNLMLGVAGTVLTHPDAYETHHGWVILEGSRPVAAAFMTPPHNLILSDLDDDLALEPLIDAVRSDRVWVPGLVANLPWAERFGKAWSGVSDTVLELALSQGVYALTEVREVRSPPGRARRATDGDRELLHAWMYAFADEALPPGSRRDREELRRGVEARLAFADAGYWLWEYGGQAVSLAGYWGRTDSGIRVGPVYTPPELRRQGYATILVAELSRWLLVQGYRACFLFTDLANPTSNRIYADIGYERVCDSEEYHFRAR